MNTYKLSNVTIRQFRQFLKDMGCTASDCNGGHEKWKKEGCLRSVILQSHIDPVPEFVIRSDLRTLGLSRKDFIDWLKNHK